MGGAFVLQTPGTTRVEGSVFVDMTEDASGEIGHLAGGTPDILCFRRAGDMPLLKIQQARRPLSPQTRCRATTTIASGRGKPAIPLFVPRASDAGIAQGCTRGFD